MTSDKEGPESVFQKHIVDVSPTVPCLGVKGTDALRFRSKFTCFTHRFSPIVQAEVLITTPFHPGYLTRDLIEKVCLFPYDAKAWVNWALFLFPCVGKKPQDLCYRWCRLRPY